MPQVLSASVNVVQVDVPLFMSQVQPLPCEGSISWYVLPESVVSMLTVPV